MDGAQCTAPVWGLNWCKLVPEEAKLVLLSCVCAPGSAVWFCLRFPVNCGCF